MRAAFDTTSWDLARWPGLANEAWRHWMPGYVRHLVRFALVFFCAFALIWRSTNATLAC